MIKAMIRKGKINVSKYFSKFDNIYNSYFKVIFYNYICVF